MLNGFHGNAIYTFQQLQIRLSQPGHRSVLLSRLGEPSPPTSSLSLWGLEPLCTTLGVLREQLHPGLCPSCIPEHPQEF